MFLNFGENSDQWFGERNETVKKKKKKWRNKYAENLPKTLQMANE